MAMLWGLRLVVAAAVFAGPPALAQSVPDFPASGPTRHLTFLNAPLQSKPLMATPKLGLSVNGGQPARAVMDTGSTGVVIAARRIPNFDSLPVIRPGSLTYSSSGRVMKGVYVKVPVTISGAGGESLTTRPMTVLAVTEIACIPTARRCTPNPAPRHTSMIGIGFARHTGSDAADLGERNAFLNLDGMGTNQAPGAMRRGYLITRRGVDVGLSADAAAGMDFIKLAPAQAGPGWAPLPVCLSLAGRQPPACGTALIDTGVTSIYLTLPPGQTDGQTSGTGPQATVQPGLSLSLAFGTGAPGYSFTVGDKADPVAPDRIFLVDRKDRVFINTSARLLNRFAYLYDADGGYVGLRPVKGQ